MGVLAENLKRQPKGTRIYQLRVIVRCLLEAEQLDRLYQLLTDADFREIKAQELGIGEVAADYRLILESECFNNPEDLSKQNNLQQIYQELLSSASS